MVDVRVKHVRRRPPHRAGDQPNARLVVDRRLVLGEHDERRAGLVQPRVHAARDLDPPRQREPDVNVVSHLVRRERLLDLGDDLVVRRDLGEGEGQC